MSVWTDIGMSQGKFYGTIPCRYYNALFYFFQKLHSEGLKICEDFGVGGGSIDGYYRMWQNTTWEGNHKGFLSYGNKRNAWNLNDYPFDIFSPLRREDFIATTPVWNSCIYSPFDVNWLKGEIIPFPETSPYYAVSTDYFLGWGEQKYNLTQLLRYVRVPVLVSHGTGRLVTVGSMRLFPGVHMRLQVPEYWKKEDATAKLAVIVHGVDGEVLTRKWVDSSIELSREDVVDVSFYGAVDLSTHPDFAQYFDDNFVFPSIDCGGGGGGDSSSPSSPSSSSPSSGEGSSWESSSSPTPPPSSSTPPPSSSTTPPSSSGGGGGDDVLEFIGFEVNTLHRNCGVVTPYAEEWIGDDTPDPQHFCYATSWDMPDAESPNRLSTVYLGSVSCDVVMNSCFGWDEAQIEEATSAMRSAQEYINARIPSAPWLRIAPIIGNDFVEAAPGGVDYNKKTGSITIEQWAFTGNAPNGNPCQAFGELTLVNLPAGVSAVWVEVWGKEYKLTIGDVLGWNELRHAFALGELPLTVIGTCGGEDGGPTWPVIQNTENSTYPWGGIGTRQTLKMTVKRWERNNNRTTTGNAYFNALPEELR